MRTKLVFLAAFSLAGCATPTTPTAQAPIYFTGYEGVEAGLYQTAYDVRAVANASQYRNWANIDMANQRAAYNALNGMGNPPICTGMIGSVGTAICY